MAVNVTFTGNIIKPDNTQFLSNEVKYQLFFYNRNASSSPSIWGSTRLSELGQYNINLGDSDILTPEGSVNIGDRVIIAFWTPNDKIKTDENLINWGFIDLPLSTSTEYINNVKLMGAIVPTCNFTITGSTVINENVFANDIGSNDNHQWIYNGLTIYQAPSKYSQPLFYSMNTLPETSISITWGDETSIVDQPPSQSYPHQFETPNTYTINVFVTNTSGLTSSQLFMRSIYNSAPVVGFSIDKPNPVPVNTDGVGETVTFVNVSTDPDNKSITDGWSCTWEIEDGDYSVTYTDQTFDFQPTHQFHSSGYHDVKLILHWYNGFSWLSSSITQQINQLTWSVTNGLTWQIPVYINNAVTYTPTVSGNVEYISKITYNIDDYVLLDNLSYNETFVYMFELSDTHIITQNIYYNNGFEQSIQSVNFTIIMSPIADFVVVDNSYGNEYTSDSEPGKQPIIYYKWKVYLYDVEVASYEGELADVFKYSWPAAGEYKVYHEIVDALNQTASIIKNYTVTSPPTPQPTPQPIASVGNIGTRTKSQTVYVETPPPTIKATLVNETSVNNFNVTVKIISK
jgi:hypothetical protein